MTEIEVREHEELVLPHTGELVDLRDEVAAALALDELRRVEAQIRDAKRALANAVAQRAAVLGTKSIKLSGGRTAVVSGGRERVYDAQAIERDLRAAGMPEERIREIVAEEVTYTLRVREAQRAAGANEEYAAIVERHATEHEKPFSVTIRRTRSA